MPDKTFQAKPILLGEYELPVKRMEEYKMERSSDGNLVNFGNFNADGANVNRWKPDNANDNLGALFSRSLTSRLGGRLLYGLDPAAKHSANFLEQPFEKEVFLLIDRLYIKRSPH